MGHSVADHVDPPKWQRRPSPLKSERQSQTWGDMQVELQTSADRVCPFQIDEIDDLPLAPWLS
jgi:hypothetical protein